MQQAWHIFSKDFRYLYREIALLLLLAMISGLMSEGDILFMELLYAAAVAFVVERLIHSEAIPGQNQFWITRPYRWQSLLAAKVMFVIAFIQLPVFVMQAVILIAGGFSIGTIIPGLLWTQVLIVLAISLPCLALAAVTAGLVPFIATILVLLAIGFVSVQMSTRSMRFEPESIDWVRYSIPLIAAAIALPPVLYLQYKHRCTRQSIGITAIIALCGTIAFVAMPWSARFAVQSLLSKQSFPVEITLDPNKPLELLPDGANLVKLSLPLLIQGVPAEIRHQVELYDLQFESPDGRTLPLATYRLSVHHQDKNPNGLVLSGAVFPDRQFLLAARDQHVRLHVTFYLTLFGNKRDKTIPFQTTPADALDGLRCLDAYLDEVVCRAPFRWPGSIVSIKTPWGGMNTFTRLISYSPFPANLQLDPIVERGAGPHWSKDRQAHREITVEIEEPLAYLRREVVVPDIKVPNIEMRKVPGGAHQ